MYALEVLTGEGADATAGAGGTGERDHADERVRHQRLADVGSARKHVQQALG
jgi:hypothetical protein